jgi:hypothetical protein
MGERCDDGRQANVRLGLLRFQVLKPVSLLDVGLRVD